MCHWWVSLVLESSPFLNWGAGESGQQFQKAQAAGTTQNRAKSVRRRKSNEQAYLTQKKTKEKDKISLLVHEMLLKGRKLFILHVEDTDNKTKRLKLKGER